MYILVTTTLDRSHHVEGEAHHVLPPPDRGDDHEVAEDAEHGQAHVQHHHQGSWQPVVWDGGQTGDKHKVNSISHSTDQAT